MVALATTLTMIMLLAAEKPPMKTIIAIQAGSRFLWEDPRRNVSAPLAGETRGDARHRNRDNVDRQQ